MNVFREKYSRTATLGWGPKMRLGYDYFTPDDHYEALVDRLLSAGDDWCDVGCGRDVFPNYPELARRCADRCAFLYGIDPDDNIQENPFVDERFQGIVEDCPTTHTFDLITMRMVAEHIENPPAVLSRLRSMLKPAGRLVIYTPHKWAPMSVLANAVPFALHNPLKRVLWATEARDTFPTQYKMNTRAELQEHAEGAGLRLVHYERVRLPYHHRLPPPEPHRTGGAKWSAPFGHPLTGSLHPRGSAARCRAGPVSESADLSVAARQTAVTHRENLQPVSPQ
jgi:2-polyprenyl-3-methyl-5-hydroxy-6-metoxy-1,4-benzoquinol methylase